MGKTASISQISPRGPGRGTRFDSLLTPILRNGAFFLCHSFLIEKPKRLIVLTSLTQGTPDRGGEKYGTTQWRTHLVHVTRHEGINGTVLKNHDTVVVCDLGNFLIF